MVTSTRLWEVVATDQIEITFRMQSKLIMSMPSTLLVGGFDNDLHCHVLQMAFQLLRVTLQGHIQKAVIISPSMFAGILLSAIKAKFFLRMQSGSILNCRLPKQVMVGGLITATLFTSELSSQAVYSWLGVKCLLSAQGYYKFQQLFLMFKG